jgi:uncharacterized protein (TIGR03435 family)
MRRIAATRCVVGTTLIVVCAAVGVGLRAQSRPLHTFEVVSVKPALSPFEAGRQAGAAAASGNAAPSIMNFGIRAFPGGRLSATTTLRALILRAYEIKDYQIEGGPKWLGEDYFAVEATAGRETTPAEFNEMLQALLVDRFGLRTHPSTRQGQIYSMVMARSDKKPAAALKQTSAECLAQIAQRKRSAATVPPASTPAPRAASPLSGPPDMTPQCGLIKTSISAGAATLSAGGQPLAILVERLSSDLGSLVVDRTGLEGLFDFVVEFEAKTLQGRPAGLDVNSTESPKLPLRVAIERQLGLKLESAFGPVPILLIDAAEKPEPD